MHSHSHLNLLYFFMQKITCWQSTSIYKPVAWIKIIQITAAFINNWSDIHLLENISCEHLIFDFGLSQNKQAGICLLGAAYLFRSKQFRFY